MTASRREIVELWQRAQLVGTWPSAFQLLNATAVASAWADIDHFS